jgi:hypothetical protein
MATPSTGVSGLMANIRLCESRIWEAIADGSILKVMQGEKGATVSRFTYKTRENISHCTQQRQLLVEIKQARDKRQRGISLGQVIYQGLGQ